MLAGEIKFPGSFSLRTLEFLKNISHEEALKIAKLAPFKLGPRHIVKSDEKLLDSEGITFDLLLDLQNLGVTCGVDSSRPFNAQHLATTQTYFKFVLDHFTRPRPARDARRRE